MHLLAIFMENTAGSIFLIKFNSPVTGQLRIIIITGAIFTHRFARMQNNSSSNLMASIYAVFVVIEFESVRVQRDIITAQII